MLIKRFPRCQEDSLVPGAFEMGICSVAQRGEELSQEDAGEEQEDQRNAQEQNHLKQGLPTAERIGRNQITHRLLLRRGLLAPRFSPLTLRICQSPLPK